MRTVKIQYLRPHEILEEKKRCPVAYLPIGPLEWHGPHLPFGMDPLNAEAISLRVAEKVGGVVLPTFYWGTERERSPQMLKSIGFNGDEWIVGMDFPENPMPSFYAVEDVFGLAVREYLRLLVKQDYKLIVIINGHGADNHIHTLERLSSEFSAVTDSKVLYTITTFLEEGMEQDFGHATKVETSIMSYLYPENVDTGTLPPKGQPIYNTRFAVVDDATFRGNPNDNFTVRDDPRDASAELGKKVIKHSVDVISDMIRNELQKLKV
jgi:creatinine amidohydrolase